MRSIPLRPVILPQPRSGTASAPLHGAKPAGWCARAIVRQRPSGHERGKSASGSAQNATLAGGRSERVPQNSRSADPAPDRHPHGPGLQARFAPANTSRSPEGQHRWLVKLEKDTASRYQQREIRFRPEATSGRRWSGLQSHPNGAAKK